MAGTIHFALCGTRGIRPLCAGWIAGDRFVTIPRQVTCRRCLELLLARPLDSPWPPADT